MYRFPIAIKSPLNVDAQEIESFLDEAKSMLQIGEYHNHIVNLQGIAFEVDDQKLEKVSWWMHF